MITVERTFPVRAQPERVIAYLRDFTATEEWDDGTVSTVRTGDTTAPLGVGTTYRNVSRFAGRETTLDYTMRVDDADRVRFEGTNKTADASDDITVRPGRSGGSELTYRAEVGFKGYAKLLEPVLRVIFNRLADRTEKQLRGVLDRMA